MKLNGLNTYFFFLLFFGVGVVVFFIFQPFLTAMVAAVILAALFRGTYTKLTSYLSGHEGWGAFFTCLVVLAIIIIPTFFVLSLAIGEANTLLYHSVGEQSRLEVLAGKVSEGIRQSPFLSTFLDPEMFNKETLSEDIKSLGKNALSLLQAAYQSVTNFVLWVFVVFFALFYFLIDGPRAIAKLMRMSPLRDEHDRLLVEKFVSISRATLKGTILVGIVQGVLGGIAFWIVGIPSPAIWGILMVLFSIIPMVGTGIVWAPAALILLLLGQFWQAIFVLVVGAGVISMIDNILRPKLVGKDSHMHPLLVFFSTLGGIALFGLSGFVIGPIIVSLFLALSEIYSIEFRSQLKEFNES